MRCDVFAAMLAFGLTAAPALAASPAELIRSIQAVGSKGDGHAAAIVAVKELSKADSAALADILNAFETASPLARNWLRGAFEAIADRAVKSGKLPVKTLEAFTVDTTHNAAARRLAYEWLLKVDQSAADRLIPHMLQDAGAEFRRDAVARLLVEAVKLREAGNNSAAIAVYQRALTGAVDDDQVKAIVKPLRDMGETVNLQQHFGFLTHWRLIGPFDNANMKGFDIVYPPEQERRFMATYQGKDGEVVWKEFRTEDEYGVVDLAKALAPHKGAITYAAAEFVSPSAQALEMRLGTPNAWKLWVNDELIFARDEYHRGTMLDQYRVPVKFRPGANTVLLKVCQNEQTEEWAQAWKYQLRVCTTAGAAVLPRDGGAKTSQRAGNAAEQLVKGSR